MAFELNCKRLVVYSYLEIARQAVDLNFRTGSSKGEVSKKHSFCVFVIAHVRHTKLKKKFLKKQQ